MSKPRQILLMTLFLAGLGLIVWWGVVRSEPNYQGHPLSYWLSRNYDDSAEAVRAIGSNAVPTLLRKLQARETDWDRQLVRLARMQKFIKVEYDSVAGERSDAYAGLTALGTNAASATPTLIRLVAQKSDPDLSRQAIMVLGEIGPPAKAAIPVLLDGLPSTNSQVRYYSADSAFRIGADPALVLPVMFRGFRDRGAWSFYKADDLMRSLGNRKVEAIPTLIALSVDTNASIRHDAIYALSEIKGEQQARVLPVVTNALTDVEYDVRVAAVITLRRFGTNAICASPLLIELYQKEQGNASAPHPHVPALPNQLEILPLIRRALNRIDPEAARKAGISERR